MIDNKNRSSEAELVAAAANEFAELYEVDELGFLIHLEEGTDFTQRQSLAGFFEIGPRYPQLASKVRDLYSALQKSKQARATLARVEPNKLRLPVAMGFMAHLDDNPYTKSLLEDVLASRIPNPVSPSSPTIVREITTMRQELYSTGVGRLTTQSIMEKIFSGKLSLGKGG